MFASTADYHKSDFANGARALSSLSTVSSSNSIVDFNTGDLLPDLWQTSSNESSVSDGLEYSNDFGFKQQPQLQSPCRNHFSSFNAQLSPFIDPHHTQVPMFLDVSPFQNYTQLPVQRASPLWHLGQSTWKVQHQQQQATTSPFHIDELYDNQQQVHILNNDIPRHQSVLNETTVSVQTPTTPSRDTSPPQSKSKTVNTQLYKTELCGPFMKTGSCPYGLKCQFAHGEAELKHIERPPKWRSKPCANWSKYGSCRYGNRCCFKHVD